MHLHLIHVVVNLIRVKLVFYFNSLIFSEIFLLKIIIILYSEKYKFILRAFMTQFDSYLCHPVLHF